MQHPKLAAIALAVLALAVPQIASAGITTSAQGCKLANTTAPYNEISQYAGYSDGKFYNNRTSNAYAMCPVAWQTGLGYFRIGTSTTTMACYLKVTGRSGGGTSLVFGTRIGNEVEYYSSASGGSYAAAITCTMTPGSQIWGMINY